MMLIDDANFMKSLYVDTHVLHMACLHVKPYLNWEECLLIQASKWK